MRKLSVLIITALLLSGCSTGEQLPTAAPGVIPSCDLIDTSKVSEKSLQMPCLDGSSEINYHSIKGPIIINVWASWCTGCKEEMPYFVDLYQSPAFKTGQIQLLGVNVEESSTDDAVGFIQKSGDCRWRYCRLDDRCGPEQTAGKKPGSGAGGIR